MTAPTHRIFGISFAMIASMLVYKYGISNLWYYLVLVIMLATAKYGALFPDVDHHWSSVKEKTVPNWIINKIIHVTGGVHRSWQTHSIDITVVVTAICWIAPKKLQESGVISEVNEEVLKIVLLGFCCGWLSHLFSDMLSSAGVRVFCWCKKTVALVPTKLFGLRFNTGHEWEAFVYAMTKRINMLIGFVCVMFPLLADGELLSKIQETLAGVANKF